MYYYSEDHLLETFSVYLNSLCVNQTLHSIVTRVWECQKALGNVMDNKGEPAGTAFDKWEVLQRGMGLLHSQHHLYDMIFEVFLVSFHYLSKYILARILGQ